MVSPRGRRSRRGRPDRSTVTSLPPQLSVAVAVPSVASRLLTVTLHDEAPAPVWSVTGVGVVTKVGPVVSTTFTTTVSSPTLPCESVTFSVMVCWPAVSMTFSSVSPVPSDVLPSNHSNVRGVSPSGSVAVPESVTVVVAPAHSTVWSSPASTSGGALQARSASPPVSVWPVRTQMSWPMAPVLDSVSMTKPTR